MTDELNEAKQKLNELIELEDEITQQLALVYLYQHGHDRPDNLCPDSRIDQIAKHVFREMMTLGMWTNVIEGRMIMHFEAGEDEPKFSMTDKGREFLENEMPAIAKTESK